MSTELQQHAEGNDRDKIEAGLVQKELAFNTDPQKMEGIYRTLNGEPSGFLHFPSEERLGISALDEDEGVVTKSDSESISGAGLIGVDETNFNVVNTGKGNLQDVLNRVDEAIGQNSLQYEFDDQNGQVSAAVKSPRSFFSQFTRDAGATSHEVVDYDTVGPQLLNNPKFDVPTNHGQSWTSGSGWSFPGGMATYTTGGGTLSQSVFAFRPFPNRWYRFKYTITVLSGTPTPSQDALPELTTEFVAGSSVRLQIGGHTIYVKSGPHPLDDNAHLGFKIKGNTLGFSITNLELAEITGGNVDAHGSLAVGGDIVVKKDTPPGSITALSGNPASPTTFDNAGAPFHNVAGRIVFSSGQASSVVYAKIMASNCHKESVVLTSLELKSSLAGPPVHVEHRISEKMDGHFIVEFRGVKQTDGPPLAVRFSEFLGTSHAMTFSWVIINTSIQ
jgi:hypothetical protein